TAAMPWELGDLSLVRPPCWFPVPENRMGTFALPVHLVSANGKGSQKPQKTSLALARGAKPLLYRERDLGWEAWTLLNSVLQKHWKRWNRLSWGQVASCTYSVPSGSWTRRCAELVFPSA